MFKKLAATLLAVLLAFGMTGVAFAVSGKITDATLPITSNSYEDTETAPGTIIEIPLTASMFTWSEGQGGSSEPVTESQLNAASISVKTRYNISSSSSYVESVTLETKAFAVTGNKKTAYIKVEFKKALNETEAKKYDFTVYLSKNGGRKTDTEVHFSGELIRPVIYVYPEDEYIDISKGEVAKTDSYIRNIEFNIGNGLILKYKMYEDKSYYGTCEEKLSSTDEKLLDAYPEIDKIYRLTTNLTAAKAFFELDDLYYAYDEDGKYIGKTDEELKFSKVYYLASEKIAMGGSGSSSQSSNASQAVLEEEEEEEVVATPTQPDSNNNNSNNVNNNPSTGLGGYASGGIALSVLVISGAVTLAIFKNKK